VARHRIHERHPHHSRHSSTRTDAPEVVAWRAETTPESVNAAIQRYWADGLDAHTIAQRLAYYGVTVQDVLAARYLSPG
jgi:hypothetical protein